MIDIGSIPRYEALSAAPVGQGGCGVVWAAYDRLFGQRVALKLLQPSILERMPTSSLRSFWKEAQAGARLGQLTPHVVQVLDYGFVDGQPFFTMEWLEPKVGASLDASSLIGMSTVGEAVGLAVQVATALEVAHRSGVIHSDVAPWNILCPQAGQVKLSDFGLLAVVENSILSEASGSLLKGGRADFQPPEVRLSITNLTMSADVYALAVTLLVLLVGDEVLPSRAGHAIDISDGLLVRKEQRVTPSSLVSLLRRYICDHTESDTVTEFARDLERVPRT